jgi:hypothetical protein
MLRARRTVDLDIADLHAVNQMGLDIKMIMTDSRNWDGDSVPGISGNGMIVIIDSGMTGPEGSRPR